MVFENFQANMNLRDSETEESIMEYASADSLNSLVDGKIRCSTSKSLTGGDPEAEWNKISSFTELNEGIDAISSLREFTKSASAIKKDGGFDIEEDVLFYSKVDLQYIPGVIKSKKKDKLTKDYVRVHYSIIFRYPPHINPIYIPPLTFSIVSCKSCEALQDSKTT